MDLAASFSSQCANIRAMHGHALTLQAAARRERDPRRARLWGRFIRKCLRALRYAARVEAGWEPTDPADPTGPACVFSESPENVFQTPTTTITPDSNRRRTFRERLRRW